MPVINGINGPPETLMDIVLYYAPHACSLVPYVTLALLRGEQPALSSGARLADFTYIDDIVEGVLRVLDRPAEPNPSWSGAAPDPASSRAVNWKVGWRAPISIRPRTCSPF